MVSPLLIPTGVPSIDEEISNAFRQFYEEVQQDLLNDDYLIEQHSVNLRQSKIFAIVSAVSSVLDNRIDFSLIDIFYRLIQNETGELDLEIFPEGTLQTDFGTFTITPVISGRGLVVSSVWSSVGTLWAPPASVPRNVRTQINSDFVPELLWDVPETGERPITYRVEYRIDMGNWTLFKATIRTLSTTLTFLMEGQTAQVRLRAENIRGSSSWVTVSVTAPASISFDFVPVYQGRMMELDRWQ